MRVLLLLALVLAASLIWRVHPWYDGEADSSLYSDSTAMFHAD
ncbi:MAG TPA: hypothetical protein VMS76_10925 [Planctomycetota bacterium]|nr:hypothetical protein [Planctomycetota bacterium]